jgi:hydrogenase maturation protease
MTNLRAQLKTALKGRLCLVGIGHVEQSDDGLGVALAEALVASGLPRLMPAEGPCLDRQGPQVSIAVAGISPECWLGCLGHFDAVIFLDAVDFSAAPGSVAWWNAGEIRARFPQVSTHKLSLGLLASLAESNGHTRAWLLGVQPQSLCPGGPISKPVQTTLDLLCALILSLATPEARSAPGTTPESRRRADRSGVPAMATSVREFIEP